MFTTWLALPNEVDRHLRQKYTPESPHLQSVLANAGTRCKGRLPRMQEAKANPNFRLMEGDGSIVLLEAK